LTLALTILTKRIADSGTASSEIDDYPGPSQDYGYDTNGNMTYDGAKNLSLKYYSTLNLPQELDFGSNNRIFYHYSAGGAKLIKHTILSMVRFRERQQGIQ
jgi:hypothetical protein